jgi:hypothetical protein
VYVVTGGYRLAFEYDDFRASVFKSTDYGQTFASLAANIPIGQAFVIREDPRDPQILYLGTRLGVYVSTNGGARWDVLGSNLPTVRVSDLQIHPRDLIIVIATYGHGMWAMDAVPLTDPARRQK